MVSSQTDSGFYRVMAEPPPGMVHVPGGLFQMGDSYSEGYPDELPVHSLHVSDFYMDQNEISKSIWAIVYGWAITNGGYTFEHAGVATDPSHPVHTISWWDAIKWCNARSEMDGLTPCYYTTAAKNVVYKDNTHPNLSNDTVDWSANGYRLPTEAEWEKAARGGLTGHHFPWVSLLGIYTDHIEGRKANYYNSGDPFDDGTTPVGWYNGSQVPAGGDMANGFGLYDMSGNVWERCWDRYSNSWYSASAATVPDCRGPDSGTATQCRVLRGGSWDSLYLSIGLRCALRLDLVPGFTYRSIGFRSVRGL